MGLRDIALFVIVFGSLPLILWRPYIGILLWSWVSYMNPHRLTYGFAYSFPFAQVVAITLFASLLFTSERKRFPVNATTVLWLILIAWMGITTVFSLIPNGAWEQYEKVLKIQVVALLTLVLINDRERVHQLVWVIVFSIGYFSTKGGLFTLTTGGAHRVYGPEGSFIQENNSLALAALMILPLVFYLYQSHKENPWLRMGFLIMLVLSTASVLGSQSRGAFLAIGAVAFFFWLKTSSKLTSGLAIVLAGVLLLSFMPQSWHDRMASITNYEEDASAQGRINAWTYSIRVANDRLTGGGFESWSKRTFAVYAPNPDSVHAAHSIFFGVLGDHGWPGLLLFCAILWRTWRSLRRVERLTLGKPEDLRLHNLAKALQVTLIAYCSGGAFLSLAYFDLPWHVIGLAVILPTLLSAEKPDESGVQLRGVRPRGGREQWPAVSGAGLGRR